MRVGPQLVILDPPVRIVTPSGEKISGNVNGASDGGYQDIGTCFY